MTTTEIQDGHIAPFNRESVVKSFLVCQNRQSILRYCDNYCLAHIYTQSIKFGNLKTILL